VKKPKGGGDAPRWSKMLDFNSPEEKEKVNGIFELAMQCLSPQDRDLPIVHKMCHMFQYGIAVHHSGLLPILKELVEILFQEQLIKVTVLLPFSLVVAIQVCLFTTCGDHCCCSACLQRRPLPWD